jgi:hypothetical protein
MEKNISERNKAYTIRKVEERLNGVENQISEESDVVLCECLKL